MCLGGGGGYQPPKQVPAAPAVAGGPPPNDTVNGQAITNANDRSAMEGNQNAMDPASTSSGSGSGSGTPNKDKMKLLTGKQHDSAMALQPAYREAFRRGDVSGQEGGINL